MTWTYKQAFWQLCRDVVKDVRLVARKMNFLGGWTLEMGCTFAWLKKRAKNFFTRRAFLPQLLQISQSDWLSVVDKSTDHGKPHSIC